MLTLIPSLFHKYSNSSKAFQTVFSFAGVLPLVGISAILDHVGGVMMMMMMMMMIVIMNCFCGMVDRRKAFSLISSRDHCQRSSPSRISDTPRAGFKPAQNLSSGFVE